LNDKHKAMVKIIGTILIIVYAYLVSIPDTEAIGNDPIDLRVSELLVNGEKLNLVQYLALKINLMDKIRNRKKVEVSSKEVNQWFDVVNIEIKKCGNWNMGNVNNQNIIDKINEKLELDNCQ